MAGGSGTRLWPESRRDRPKQLLNLQGDRTMIQATVDRLGDLVAPEQVLIATTEGLADKIQAQLPELPRGTILCEPQPRNTAPCIGLAAVRIVREDPDAVMAVMPADHVIRPAEVFRDAIRFAAALVEENPDRLITFGIRPSYPSAGFGYIERGEPLEPPGQAPPDQPPPAYGVKQFHEKPSLELAGQYVDAGRFYWNAGIFLWKAQTSLDALGRFEPEIFRRLDKIARSAAAPDFAEVLECEFSAMPKISIDYAVMERAEEVAVVEAPFEWDDVGGWRALERLRQVDADGNLLDAPRCVQVGSSGTILRSGDPDHVVALLGVEDLIVIVTPDATLIANKEDDEAIRSVIARLEEQGWQQHL